MTSIWGNSVVLAHIEPATGLQTQTLGVRMTWRNPELPAAFTVERSRETGAGSRKVEIIEVGHFQEERIVAKDLGYGITGTL